jgi:chaperonin GroES
MKGIGMITPIGEKIAVIPKEAKELSDGGIYIPDGAQEKPAEGNVVSVGCEVKQIKVGDSVMYSKYSGSEIENENIKYLIMRENDVLAIIEG